MTYFSPISNRNPEPNNRQLLTLLIIGLITIGVIIMAVFWTVNQAINLIPTSLEEQLGNVIVPEYEAQREGSTTESSLNQLLDSLESKLVKPHPDYRLIYIAEPTINALAIPGNVIVLYEGLLKQLSSENSLSMILGHELGHFAHRDHLRRLGNILAWQILLSYWFGNLADLKTGIDWLTVITQAQFSQQQEIQADRFGLDLCYQYYGHVGGTLEFFENIQDSQSLNIPFLATHPIPATRIQKLNQIIKEKSYGVETPKPLNSDLAPLSKVTGEGGM